MSYTDKMVMRIIEEILPPMPENVTFKKPESRFFNTLMREVLLYIPQELKMPVERCFYVVIAGIEKDDKAQHTAQGFIFGLKQKIKEYYLDSDTP